MTVLIAGCGDLGTEVGLRLVALGQHVVGLRRQAGVIPAALNGQSVDLSRQQPEVPPDTEIVIVAIAAGNPDPTVYRAAYVTGLANLLGALEAARVTPRRFLMVSSTAVYDVNDGSTVDEDTPATPGPGTDAILLEAEQLLRSRIPSAVVLRLGGIYGPGRDRLIRQVREGRATVAARGRLSNRIHRDDAAAMIVHLVLRNTAPDRLYLGVDSTPVPVTEVLGFLAGELGLPDPEIVETGGRRGGDKRLSNRRILETGFTFAYPSYREGYRAVLAGHGVRHP
ncbi:SDR family NAD(P)-dependent oxidoreductase [Cryobacterium adonitolivorans]|uniref:SDR family NAD(P)-dependent oxidoreductase n=1 Tax=Cryobacterium adonitolivorans TaxID=1259189 RepID=A0A4R8W5T8_9MICO|nr:NAD-dependent epimerase/dehydratase family protein [Cryobacterium adonitolivorans]TFC03191.1 SDR family NAD(P)-dependent oxidoreductase [Cryobacterium adonitolivorans]